MSTDLTAAQQNVLAALRTIEGPAVTQTVAVVVGQGVPAVARILGGLRTLDLVVRDEDTKEWSLAESDEPGDDDDDDDDDDVELDEDAPEVVANPAFAPKETRWRFGVRRAIAHRAEEVRGGPRVEWVIVHPVTGVPTEVTVRRTGAELPAEKTCPKCGVTKDIGGFGVRACAVVSKAGGELVLTKASIRPQSQCKKCRKAKGASGGEVDHVSKNEAADYREYVRE